MQNQDLPFVDDGELVCHCMGVTAYAIKSFIYNHPDCYSLETYDITNALGAGGGCSGCLSRIQDLIDEVLELKTKEAAKAK